MSIPRKYLLVVSLAGLGTAVLAGAQQPAALTPSSDLNTCAAITAQAERLACYDKLAGRGVAPATAPTPAGSQASSKPPTSPATQPSAEPPAARGGQTSAAATASGATQASPTAPPASAPASGGTAAPPAPGSKEAFGLYKAEHPAAPTSTVETVTAKIVELTYDAYGRETVSLEGGPMWQLAGSDALLASGDSVTIKRAAFGSYILTTPAGRTHRVRRLR